jgi:hypothetical protein
LGKCVKVRKGKIKLSKVRLDWDELVNLKLGWDKFASQGEAS